MTAKLGSDLDREHIQSSDHLPDILYFTAFTSVIIMIDNPART